MTYHNRRSKIKANTAANAAAIAEHNHRTENAGQDQPEWFNEFLRVMNDPRNLYPVILGRLMDRARFLKSTAFMVMNYLTMQPEEKSGVVFSEECGVKFRINLGEFTRQTRYKMPETVLRALQRLEQVELIELEKDGTEGYYVVTLLTRNPTDSRSTMSKKERAKLESHIRWIRAREREEAVCAG